MEVFEMWHSMNIIFISIIAGVLVLGLCITVYVYLLLAHALYSTLSKSFIKMLIK